MKFVVDPPPPPTCDGSNEIYKTEINACGNTCANYGKKCNIYPYVPIKGCDCIDGFARLVDKGECVSVNDARCLGIKMFYKNFEYSNHSFCSNAL